MCPVSAWNGSKPSLCLLGLLTVLLTGCATSFNPMLSGAAPNQTPLGTMTGAVHGGQQPIAGAHVYVYAASTTGYGGAGIAASTANASTSLLTSYTTGSFPTAKDGSNNYYVTTDSGGNFALTGEYTCTAGTQVYLYVIGGDPTPGVANTSSGLMAALGQCPAGGSMASLVPVVIVNEVTTVAAAYAFAGFATDALHVGSSGTPLAKTGIANAFATAGQLDSLPNANGALATTPTGAGTVPQAEVNSIANSLAACINSASPFSNCTTLFADATANGQPSGTQPTDTATAAINIAHYPAINVAGIFGLAGSTPPFAPFLSAAPNDFTIGINYTGGTGTLNAPFRLGIDGSGNVWVDNYTGGSLSEFSPLGGVLLAAKSGGGLEAGGEPYGFVIDNANNIWVSTAAAGTSPIAIPENLSEYNSTTATWAYGTSGLGFTGSNVASTRGIAIDASGYVWVVSTNNYLSQLNPGTFSSTTSTGTWLSPAYTSAPAATAPYANGGLDSDNGVAIDGSGNVWVANYSAARVSEFNSAGSPVTSATGYTGDSLATHARAIAIDSTGNVWVPSTGALSEFSNAGVASSTSFTGGDLGNAYGVSIDGAGNIWLDNDNENTVTEFSNTGTVISPSTGFMGGGTAGANMNVPYDIAVDGSGNVWVCNSANSPNSSLSEFVGAAVPVVTPVSAGLTYNLANNTGNGASSLGTRP